jgi:polysaccharide deacetylase 2 family uncharacterized protein YibQ
MAGAGLRSLAAFPQRVAHGLAQTTWPPSSGILAGWAGLGRAWIGILALLVIGVGVLQTLGPPRAPGLAPMPEKPATQRAGAKPDSGSAEKIVAAPPGKPKPAESVGSTDRPGRTNPGPVHDPDPALLEPDREPPHALLPRIAGDGRAPMREYAAGFDPSSRLARVGILVAALGMSEADTSAAIRLLPGAVTLAFSPYATNIARLLASARIAEHEYLLSIPMEPQGFPAKDPDDRYALMTSLAPTENLKRLHWAMSRFAGYVGVTNALGQLTGERLSAMLEQFEPVLKDVASRGLLFADGRPGQPALRLTWNRSVDLVIDGDPLDESSLDGRLESLGKLARDKGSALGLVTVPRPMTLDRVAAWTNTLREKGLVLAPLSAIVVPPAAAQDTINAPSPGKVQDQGKAQEQGK